MERNFEPGQRILVRHLNGHCTAYTPWRLDAFSHLGGMNMNIAECTSGKRFLLVDCIPFNDDTRHLLGTTDPYTPPVDEATRFKKDEPVEILSTFGWIHAKYIQYMPGKGHIVRCDIGPCTQPPDKIREKVEEVHESVRFKKGELVQVEFAYGWLDAVYLGYLCRNHHRVFIIDREKKATRETDRIRKKQVPSA